MCGTWYVSWSEWMGLAGSSVVSICFLAFLIWVGHVCLCVLPNFASPAPSLGSTDTCTLSHACLTLYGRPIMCSCAVALIVHSQSRDWVELLCIPKSQCPTSSAIFSWSTDLLYAVPLSCLLYRSYSMGPELSLKKIFSKHKCLLSVFLWRRELSVHLHCHLRPVSRLLLSLETQN